MQSQRRQIFQLTNRLRTKLTIGQFESAQSIEPAQMRTQVSDERQTSELRYDLVGPFRLRFGPVSEAERRSFPHDPQGGQVGEEPGSPHAQVGHVGPSAYLQFTQLVVQEDVDGLPGQLVVGLEFDGAESDLAPVGEFLDDEVVEAMPLVVHLEEAVSDFCGERRGGFGGPVGPWGPFIADAPHAELDEGIRGESGQPGVVHAASIGGRGRADAPAAPRYFWTESLLDFRLLAAFGQSGDSVLRTCWRW